MQTPITFRFIAITGVLLALLLASCGGSDSSDDDTTTVDNEPVIEPTEPPAETETIDDEPTAEPTEPAEDPVFATPEPNETPEIDDPTNAEDPRALLNWMQQLDRGDEADTEALYAVLADRFHVLEYDHIWVQTIAQNLSVPGEADDVTWEIEDYERYSVVRHPEFRQVAFVFVEEDGAWRWDPGDHWLLQAAGRIEAGPDEGFSVGMSIPEDYQMEQFSDADVDLMPPPVGYRLTGVVVQETHIDVAVEWVIAHTNLAPQQDDEPIDSHLLADTTIPLDQITWHAGEQSGGVEIIWSTAQLTDGALVLPGWPNRDSSPETNNESPILGELRYRATLRLIDVPSDAERITLQTSDMQIGPFDDTLPELDGEHVSFRFEHTFPPATSHPVLTGEPPQG